MYSHLIHSDRHVHFVGIGGISMSALAKILKASQCKVTGSDINRSHTVKELEEAGIPVDIPHQVNAIEGAGLVVYTAAVKQDNVELVYAREHNIPCMERAKLLGVLMERYADSVAVAGTHGKTTVTSMISQIVLRTNLDPTVLVGGELSCIGGNLRIGKSSYFISEACEYVDSFLNFHPSISVILNIEEDHLDYFSGIEQIRQSFAQFAAQTKNKIICCGEDENIRLALKDAAVPVTTYGIGDGFDYCAQEIEEGDTTRYTLCKGREPVCAVSLVVSGRHNIKNSLAALACADALGIPLPDAAANLSDFTGAKRRFEYKGVTGGVTVYDDYAHHPTEIQSTLQAASARNYRELWCVFQPHTYTRTRALFDDFTKSFMLADHVIITDIYAAREKDTGLVHAKDLADAIDGAIYLKGFEEIAEYLHKNTQPADMVLTIGAGTVYQIGELFLNRNTK